MQKWAGTQSKITEIPFLCMWLTNHIKSFGVPNREVGAKYPVH